MLQALIDDLATGLLQEMRARMSDGVTREQFRRQVDDMASQLLGFDVRNPLVRPYYDRLVASFEDTGSALFNMAVSAPPKSIHAVAEVIKEDFGSGVDSMAARFAAKMQTPEGGENALSE